MAQLKSVVSGSNIQLFHLSVSLYKPCAVCSSYCQVMCEIPVRELLLPCCPSSFPVRSTASFLTVQNLASFTRLREHLGLT